MLSQDDVLRSLNRYKDKLQNLTKKNRDIFYKENKLYSLNVSKKHSDDKDLNCQKSNDEFEGLSTSSKQMKELFEKNEICLDYLDINNNNELLEKKLEKLKVINSRYQREFGLTGTWLLGPFLCWRMPNETNQIVYSPIFKIAVDIRKGKSLKWFLHLENNEIFYNPALLIMLKKFFGIEIKNVGEFKNIHEALENFINVIHQSYSLIVNYPNNFKNIFDENISSKDFEFIDQINKNKFSIIDCFYCDYISASKTNLSNDYIEIENNLTENSLVYEILLGKSVKSKLLKSKTAKELDCEKEKNIPFVIDIDSSQHRAIDRIAYEKSIVIQGPPGTGKSQTITNLIAKLLSEGKKILFVAEKRAALDVVYSRLKKANLDSQVIIMHSSDQNRSDFYKKLIDIKEDLDFNHIKSELSSINLDLDIEKKVLNDYCYELKKLHADSGLYHSEILFLKSKVINKNKINLDEDFNPQIGLFFSKVNYFQLSSSENDFNEIMKLIFENNNNYINNIWNKRKDYIDINYELRKSFIDNKIEYQNIYNSYVNLINECSSIDEQIIYTLTEKYFNLFNSLKDIIESYDEKYIEIINNELITEEQEKLVLEKISNVSKILIENKKYYKSNINEENVYKLKLYFTKNNTISEFFKIDYWKFRKLAKETFNIIEKDKIQECANGYINYSIALNEFLTLLQDIGMQRIGFEEPEKTIFECNSVYKKLTLSFEIRKNMKNIFKEKVPRFRNFRELENFLENFNKINKHNNKIKEYINNMNKIINNFNSYFKNDILNLDYFENISLIELILKDINYFDEIEKIDMLVKRLEIKMGLIELKKLITSELIKYQEKWGTIVLAMTLEFWCKEILSSAKVLKLFSNDIHINSINKFNRILDEKENKSFQSVIVSKIDNRINKSEIKSSFAYKLLEIESKKLNKQKSPREMMKQEFLDIILELKSCWLMSPLSISQILPAIKEMFDIVIFDEASQIKVEDALPSIYRAKKIVIVGDTNQMPPTNFFNAMFLDEEINESEDLGDSILDLASRIYPSDVLQWHYRSKSEALIAFSNRAFYSGNLIACPNPQAFTECESIKFHLLENAYYNSEGNEVEANAVVDFLSEKIKLNSKISIGIIAFSIKQQKLIETKIEDRCNKDLIFKNALEENYNLSYKEIFNGLFVKNLENVQGDERDHIIISVGFAPIEKEKELRKHFGPISIKGGEKRLNVAITRARESINIFCSFDPTILEIDELAFEENYCNAIFARYLNYAKAVSEKNEKLVNLILNYFPFLEKKNIYKSSIIINDIKNELKNLNFKVKEEVGSNGFYVDLAIESSKNPNSFILGIECDASFYCSLDYSRDRDRIRMQLLKSRGWNLEKIWSFDWLRNRKKVIEKIQNRVLELQKNENN